MVRVRSIIQRMHWRSHWRGFPWWWCDCIYFAIHVVYTIFNDKMNLNKFYLGDQHSKWLFRQTVSKHKCVLSRCRGKAILLINHRAIIVDIKIHISSVAIRYSLRNFRFINTNLKANKTHNCNHDLLKLRCRLQLVTQKFSRPTPTVKWKCSSQLFALCTHATIHQIYIILLRELMENRWCCKCLKYCKYTTFDGNLTTKKKAKSQHKQGVRCLRRGVWSGADADRLTKSNDAPQWRMVDVYGVESKTKESYSDDK